MLTADGPMYPVCCEAIFNEHPAVRRSALVGVGPEGRQRPVIVLEPHRGQMPKGRSNGQRCSRNPQLGASNPLTARITTSCCIPFSRRHPSQRQDFPREAGPLGGKKRAQIIFFFSPQYVLKISTIHKGIDGGANHGKTSEQVSRPFETTPEGTATEGRGGHCTEDGTTRGDLRQGLLRDFLEETLPSDYSTRDGFVFDIVGHESPQLDIILWDRRRGPTAAVTSARSYIPIESAYAVIEVKSTFQSKDEEQLDRQISSMMGMKPLDMGDGLWDFVVPFYVFAYCSTLSVDACGTVLRRSPDLIGVVVVGDKYLYKDRQVVKEVDDSDFDGTLAFVSHLCHVLARQSATRLASHRVWRAYLEGYEETKR